MVHTQRTLCQPSYPLQDLQISLHVSHTDHVDTPSRNKRKRCICLRLLSSYIHRNCKSLWWVKVVFLIDDESDGYVLKQRKLRFQHPSFRGQRLTSDSWNGRGCCSLTVPHLAHWFYAYGLLDFLRRYSNLDWHSLLSGEMLKVFAGQYGRFELLQVNVGAQERVPYSFLLPPHRQCSGKCEALRKVLVWVALAIGQWRRVLLLSTHKLYGK